MKPREDFSLIKVILWDIDGTLLNFKMSERYAIDYCFNKFHMGTCTDEMLQRYSVINRGYWERLETGELTREQVMLGRFHEFFESEGLPPALYPVPIYHLPYLFRPLPFRPY